MSDQGAPTHSAVAALGVRDFRIFWVAALVSNTGSWMQNAAIPFVIFQIAGRNLAVGITGFWQYVPVMVMGIVGGSLADRFNRRHLLIGAQVVQAVLAVLLYLDIAAGTATVTRITVLAFLSGLAGGLNIPIWQSFVTELVPRPLLANAITLNSTQFNAARALGPLVGFAAASVLGPAPVFLINAISFGAVLIALPMIRVGKNWHRPRGPRPNALTDLVAGARYVAASPGIRACCYAIIAIAGIGSPLFSFLPASFGQQVFGLSTVGIGVLAGASGLGVAPSVWLAVVAVAIFGGAYLAIASAINTTIQLLARDDMRGKSVAIYIACLTGSLPVGLYLWGLFADRFGIRATAVTAGCLLIVVTAVFAVTGRFTAMASADEARSEARGQ